MISRITHSIILTSLITVFLSSQFLMAASEAPKPVRDCAHLPVQMAPVYNFPDAVFITSSTPAKAANKIPLDAGSIRSNPEVIGHTTYDYQHNCSMGRQVEHRGTDYIHFDWMAQSHDVLGVGRGIGYQAYDLSTCSFVFVDTGLRIEDDYAGFVSLDVDSSGYAIPIAHQYDSDYTRWRLAAFWDYTPSGIVPFGVFIHDFPADGFGWGSNDGTGPGNENMWPKIEWQLGTETVLHSVATESENFPDLGHTISYYRRVGGYGIGQDGQPNGSWTDQRVIDTVVNTSVTIASSRVSDKVAIVWNAPVDYKRDTPDEFDNQYENDIWYAISDIQGAEWAHDTVSTNLSASSIGHMVDLGMYQGGNITNYDPTSDFKAYCDISALISTDDELHITWGCRRWINTTTLFRRQGAIFHWAENSPSTIRGVALADWDTGGACYGHSWGTDVAKMTISECNGRFYILYTQFGNQDNPCGDADNVNNVVNGYLYMSVYDPAVSLTWDRPQRVTTTLETPDGCIPGDLGGPGTCNSEYWASMGRYGRLDTCNSVDENVLDLLYINDYAPGACIHAESGVWTLNPIIWLQVPCREAVGWIGYHDDAGFGLGLCYGSDLIFANPIGVDSFHVTLMNLGTIENNFLAEIYIDSGNGLSDGDSTSAVVNPSSGVIPPIGEYYGWGSETLSIIYTTENEQANSIVYGHLEITHEGVGSPRLIPFCINIGEGPWPPMTYILETPCKRLRVYANGHMSYGNSNEALDYIDDPDSCADIYLYDGSPLICHDVGGEARCFFSIYGNSYPSDDALWHTDWIVVDSSSEFYVEVTTNMITADSMIGVCVQYYTPKPEEYCQFVLKRMNFYNLTEDTLYDVVLGEVVDWDIPSFESGLNNESAFDATRELIWQYSCGTDACDSGMSLQRCGGMARPVRDAIFKNAMTIENDIYMYQSGPFGSEAPLPDDTILSLMKGVDGFLTALLDSCEDITTLATYDVYTLDPGDTICVSLILATSRYDTDGSILAEIIDSANAFIDVHNEISCFPGQVSTIPGDANDDGLINVGDAVYIIAYIFKEGPPPVPYPVINGDANGDCLCNIGDAVYIVNYIFREGPPPVDIVTWMENCY